MSQFGHKFGLTGTNQFTFTFGNPDQKDSYSSSGTNRLLDMYSVTSFFGPVCLKLLSFCFLTYRISAAIQVFQGRVMIMGTN